MLGPQAPIICESTDQYIQTKSFDTYLKLDCLTYFL